MKSPSRGHLQVLTAALLLGAGIASSSCTSYIKKHQEFVVRDLPIDAVWTACVETARTEFRLDPAKVDVGQRRLTTRWRNDLRAFGQGRRRRAYFEVLPGEGERVHRVRYYVELQRYGEMASQLEPKEEEWKEAGQDGAIEMRLGYHLKLRADEAKGRRGTRPGRVPMGDPLRRR